MTKKHFEAFAARIKRDVTTCPMADLRETVRAANYTAQMVADIAQADNPRFDRDRFMVACGLRSEEALRALRS